jgi:hypothetical protein
MTYGRTEGARICDSLRFMDMPDRKARAELRRRMAVLKRTSLKRVESDLSPVSGLAAISLVGQLTRESWAAARKESPTYQRKEIPVRFIPGKFT